MRSYFFTMLKWFLLLMFVAPVTITAEETLTTSALKMQGVQPLNDSGLKSLLVGQTLVLRDGETGKLYEATFYRNGQRLLLGLSDQGTTRTAARSFYSGAVAQGIAPYKIRDSKLITTFSGKKFLVQIYKWKDKYFAADVVESDSPAWEILDRAKRRPNIKIITIAALQEDGFRPLDDKALADLIVGKTLIITNRGTGGRFEATYSTDGQRTMRDITEKRLDYMAFGVVRGSNVTEGSAPYEIKDGHLVTTLNELRFSTQVYKVDDKYYGAGGGEGGMVNWEIEELKKSARKK